METKLARLKTAYASGDYRTALRIASRFPRLGEHKTTITRAWSALTNPRFHRQIHQDPDSLVVAGIAALKTRYSL